MTLCKDVHCPLIKTNIIRIEVFFFFGYPDVSFPDIDIRLLIITDFIGNNVPRDILFIFDPADRIFSENSSALKPGGIQCVDDAVKLQVSTML